MKAKWLVLAGVLVWVVVLGVRVAVEGRRELALAQEAKAKGEVEASQRHYLLAARWYLPVVGVQEEAVSALLALGEEALASGDAKRATLAFDDARGALYGSAWLWVPHKELLAKADDGLARSLARWNQLMQSKGETAAAFTEEEARERIGAVVETNGWGLLGMGVGFLVYGIALGVAAWNWHRESFRRWPWLAASGAGMGLWIVSMFLA